MKEIFQIYRSALNYVWNNTKMIGYLALIIFPIIWFNNSDFIDLLLPSPTLFTSFIILFFLFRIILAVGIAGIVNETIPNQPIKFTNMLKYGKKFYVRILGLSVALLITILLMILPIVPFEKFLTNSIILGSVLGAVLAVTVYYFIPIYLLSYFSIICEDKGIIESIKRGYHLCRQGNTRLKVFGLLLMNFLTFSLIGVALGLVYGLLFETYFEDGYDITNSFLTAFLTTAAMVCFPSVFISFFRKQAGNLSSQNNLSM